MSFRTTVAEIFAPLCYANLDVNGMGQQTTSAAASVVYR